MIVKMKKVSLVVVDSTKKDSLKKLRKLGVVHLEKMEGNSAVLSAYRESSSETDKAIAILEETKTSKKHPVAQVTLDKAEAAAKAKEIVALTERKKSLFDSMSQDSVELSRFDGWGAVDPAWLQSFVPQGMYLYMYEIPAEKYSLIGSECKTVLVNTVSKTARFLLVSEKPVEERPAGLPPEAYAVPLPAESTQALADGIRSAEQEISRIDHDILTAKKYEDALRNYRSLLASDIEFENVCSGMEHESSEKPGDCNLAWLTGYVPVDSMDSLKKACSEYGWAMASCDPAEDDPVPTKLKNNKVVSLIYPLTNFLDVTPGYNEYDISGWFLLFFCIFFAMIFGDAGYGALVSIIAFIMMAKGAKSGKALAPINVLVLLLGLCTMAWGVLTCTWFGIESSKLPSWMVDISFAPISAAKIGSDAANTNQQIFCFILAIIQLSIAHLKGVIRYRHSLRCLGELGSMLELWGMFYVVMNMVVDAVKYPLGITPETLYFFGVDYLPVPYVAIAVLLAGFALNFIFSNYSGSIKDSVLESCRNIISVLLGIVNVFSDIVSYIRLWAVALAGAAISSTINTMAGPMFGKLTIVVFGVVLLCFGHGLNIILNLLSVIVHGVRLNTLEFSQHLGMSWSGTKYSPFSEK